MEEQSLAGERSFWPLFDLVVRTPRLEMRLPRDDEFGALIALIDQGIHDPSTMPFTNPFTDTPSPRRARQSAQFWWRERAEWSADKWSYSGAIFVDGSVVGVQGMMAEHFAVLRSVETGSWLGRAFQGQGLGKEPRLPKLVDFQEGQADRGIRVRMDRDSWEARRRDDIEIIGLEGCLDMFVGSSDAAGA